MYLTCIVGLYIITIDLLLKLVSLYNFVDMKINNNKKMFYGTL